MWAKQSTAATLIVGPILDSTGAEYTGAVIGDLSISKNGGTLTALAAAATLTHIANGQYTLVMTTGNLDTLGRLQITCNKSTYQMPPIGLNIVPAMVFDSMVLGTDVLQADTIQFGGTNGTFDAGKPTAVLDSASVNAVADQVWDEAYADHTTAGTFGKLMDIIRKANLSVDGTVSGTPTVNTFDTDLTDPTSTHKHQLLVFTSGALEGVSRPILSYTQTNGQIVLQEDLPSAPSASDEFTILIQHVHPVSEIQDGLATQASVDAMDGNVDAIKAKTDQFVFSVANQVDANALTGGGGGDATLTKQNEILSRLSGVAITTTGRVASGGALTIYLGDDHKVRSGTELEISVSDVGGALYTRLDALGTSALTFGAARLDQSPGQITGTIAAIDTSGSGADEVCVITVEITAAGEGLRPADDYEYQIAQKQTQGSEIDDYVEISGTCLLYTSPSPRD